MKDHIILKKNKKLFLELEYLYAELDYFEENLKEAVLEFKEAFFEYSKNNNLGYVKKEEYKPIFSDVTAISTFVGYKENSSNQNNYQYETPPQNSTQSNIDETQEKDEDLNKLFKNIASITHPDIISANENEQIKQKKTNQFIEAHKAYKDKNWYKLCLIAISLGLQTPQPKKEHLKWMENETNKIRERIEFIKTTFSWVWYNEENEANKQNIMRNYFVVLANKK